MTLSLRPVVRDDVATLIAMIVRPDQERFVSSNAKTLAEAAYEPGAEVFAICDEDRQLGLISWIDFRQSPYHGTGDSAEYGYVWRIMIDPACQGRGYGKKAMHLILKHARDVGVKGLFICAVPDNVGAIGLYEALGFIRTGDLVDGEVELKLDF
ncbi:MAG: GNAT family N-acetyltransferase [Pseudomonadota bacterium]